MMGRGCRDVPRHRWDVDRPHLRRIRHAEHSTSDGHAIHQKFGRPKYARPVIELCKPHIFGGKHRLLLSMSSGIILLIHMPAVE